jgi:hypothetical protein
MYKMEVLYQACLLYFGAFLRESNLVVFHILILLCKYKIHLEVPMPSDMPGTVPIKKEIGCFPFPAISIFARES